MQVGSPPLELVWLISCSKYKLFGFSSYIMRWGINIKMPWTDDLMINAIISVINCDLSIAMLGSLKSDLERRFLVKQMVGFCFSSNLSEDPKRRKATKMLNDFLPEIIIAACCNPESNEQLVCLKETAHDILSGITWRLVSLDPFLRTTRQLLLAIFQGGEILEN